MKNLKRCSSTLELLPHDVVEHIMERLPAKSLLRFKCVSKKWKSTIESVYFQKRHLIHSSDDPQLLLLYMPCDDVDFDGPNIQVLDLDPPVTAVKIPSECTLDTETTCDGLVCLYSLYKSGMVANPTTGWTRTFPPSAFQHLILDLQDKLFVDLGYPPPSLGFGKDILRSTYKLVWLYNSEELGLDNATTCEVFDFTTYSWRYVVPASPHRIGAFQEPLYFDGSLHWFTESQDTKLISFCLHTETFQVISNKLPFADDHVHIEEIAICTLHNSLCISHKKQLDQLIWSFDSGKKTWVKLYSIDLGITSPWFGMHRCVLSALAFPPRTGKKTNFLLYDPEFYEHKQRLVSHDPETNTYDLFFTAKSIGRPLCYFPSLISIP